MKGEIQIVTAFFSIGRENWNGFDRSDELYFNYFKKWAKLKNQIIVYTDREILKEKIMAFRGSIGLGGQTQVVLVPNLYELAPDLYGKMQAVAKNPIHCLYRLKPGNPEVWSVAYDYVVSLKAWCCADAVEKGYADGMVAWMDFGFNHGGSIIDSRSDFNFLWAYDFPEKINVFIIQDLDDRPIFDIIVSMDTYIMGFMIVAPAQLWGTFWKMMKNNMEALASVGFIDDDQSVMLMCLRENPEMFNTYKSSWFMPLKQFGGEQLILKDASGKSWISLAQKCYHKMKHWMLCVKYSCRVYLHLIGIEIH